jgi:bifunctional oligoribonuclease and PAP phosphatase NrnA
MERIIDHLRTVERVLVASHENPDGDAIGSLIAMGLALEAMGRRVTFFNPSKIPTVYRFLPAVRKVSPQIPENERYDTAIVIDCGSLNRLGDARERIERLPAVINIDHHITNTCFGTHRWVDTEACASAEMVYRIIQRLGVTIDQAMASAIYTGILTDTGSFRFNNTNSASFAICLEMVSKGVDPSLVARHVYGTYSMGRIKLLNLALDTIEISRSGRVSVMAVTQEMLKETGTQVEEADGLINYARRIEDVRVAVLIKEEANGNGSEQRPYHISLRSDGSVDVAAIATGFGGGGHRSAAGFSISGRLPEIKSRIVRVVENG